MPVDISDVVRLIGAQEAWRRTQTINLIASENAVSRAVRDVQNSDFMGRYAEGHPNEGDRVNRYYQGTAKIDEVERMAREEMKRLFRCRQADVRPISGNAANTAIALGYLRGGDPIIVNSTDAGGHISHNTIGTFGRRIQTRGKTLTPGRSNFIPLHFFPLTEDRYHTDVQKGIDLIEQVSPRMVILGRSLFLFPEPVRGLSEVCRAKGIPILYDGAHVLGLIAGGQFQDPLREGATYLTASTHKTFPGPQRGVILADLEGEGEQTYWPPVDRGVFPGSSSNHHLHTLPALVVAAREMQAHGRAYAAQTVANAQALGRALDEQGIPAQARAFGYTKSHQIAVDVSAFGGGVEVARRLEQSDIIVNYNMLPGDRDPRNPSGLRIGGQEMTRFGMGEAEMGQIAEFMAAAIKGKNVKAEVNRFRGRYVEMQYV
ncbi:MAG: glycine hydroxymethyltransferase [Candidatus Handelsmanbacteria bacterium RIFCSPLOWO2_12_FULL_64_10]|uniref:Glycine hydroxymethyltransferase n=1 Tax=Handelsmanbacteria sp. (strain RIFCSPLOWO2_12_FULL_64_10) TaxID=1817868 RepID=A0A1F6D501_HANXR|nr:MAG: glycine hydroxymethyltransferase [Candidatus Handelsmanbacteria bacterium RIFCSPLOWO2_12_FULL_64_10]